MSTGVFITGTDTGIGKTWFTVLLMEALKKQGKIVSGMKPIASGAELKNGKLVNEDAELIMQHCSKPTDYELINPVVYELPVAPHIAARKENQTVSLDQIVACYRQLANESEFVVVEGVGGWRVPLSDKRGLVDLVRALDMPVILVVGLKLGCISHAKLTAEAIRADGISLLGFVSSHLDEEYLFAEETIASLKSCLNCSHLADIAYIPDFDSDELPDKNKITVDFLFR